MKRTGKTYSTLLGVLSACSLVHPVDAQVEYEIEIIRGMFCDIFGYETAIGQAVNNSETLVGYLLDCNIEELPFVWMRETGWELLEQPPGFAFGRAVDINDAGQIVGFLEMNFRRHAILWENGNAIPLGIPAEGNSSQAMAINSAGQIAGFWMNTVFGPVSAYIWEDGVMTDLELPLGPWDQAHDINDHGEVVGWMGCADSIDSHAFIWRDGEAADLGVIPGGFTGVGVAINNLGDVAVVGRIENGDDFLRRSFLWKEGGYIDLGVLPGFDETIATDLNDAGTVVGYCWCSQNPSLTAPFVWNDGVLSDLGDLTMDGPGDPQITLPWGLNSSGQIAGAGGDDDTGAVTAVLLTPVGTELGDLDDDGVVGSSDLIILLGAWGRCPGDCPADLDGDGVVGTSDLILLLGNWG